MLKIMYENLHNLFTYIIIFLSVVHCICLTYIIGWTGCYTAVLGIFQNSVSKCYVVYLRHTVVDSV